MQLDSYNLTPHILAVTSLGRKVSLTSSLEKESQAEFINTGFHYPENQSVNTSMFRNYCPVTTHFHVKHQLTKLLPANVYTQATWASVGVTVLTDKAYSMLETVE